MAQSRPIKPIALVVEDDELQRELVATLLEESEMGVIQCDTAETAIEVIEKLGPSLSMLFTDINLAGSVDGVELARFACQRCSSIHIVITSGTDRHDNLPGDALFMQKPWLALDLLREAERAQLHNH
jgi:CheY-like chemotaxis protein